MDKKKILIVSGEFYPLNTPRSFRTTELAKEFARQGHEVTVLTPKDPKHTNFEKKYRLSITGLGKPSSKPIELKGRGIALLFRRALLNPVWAYVAKSVYFSIIKPLFSKLRR